MFEEIKAKDLFSWENLEYTIPVSGISQIIGFNKDDGSSEGSGKSAIFNILCWVLFGKIPKDAKIDEVVREGCKGGWGSVTVPGYEIYRSRKPNKLHILNLETEELIKGKDAKETQTLINDLIGLDFDAFTQAVYFAQNNPKRFITANETEKVKILSELEDLSIYDSAALMAHETEKSYDKAIKDKQDEGQKLRTEAQVLKEKLNTLRTVLGTLEQKRAEQLTLAETEIHDIEQALIPLQALQKELEETNSILTQQKELVSKLMGDSDDIGAQIHSNMGQQDAIKNRGEKTILLQTIKTSLEDRVANADKSCPLCATESTDKAKTHIKHNLELDYMMLDYIGDTLTEEHSPGHLMDLVEQFKELIELQDVVNLKIGQEQAELLEIEEKLQDLKRKNLKREVLLERLSNAHKKVKLIKAEPMAVTDQEIIEGEIELKALEQNTTKVTIEVRELTDTQKRYKLLRDSFKKTKAFVFTELLEELSLKATNILTELFEVPVSIAFTNEKEGEQSKIQTIVTIDGKPRSLGLFSGGQFRRISIAVDLAIANIVANRSVKPINFRILDEPFKDLSEESMTRVIKVFENLKGTTLIIEHNSIVKSIINSTFTVEYSKGVSYAA